MATYSVDGTAGVMELTNVDDTGLMMLDDVDVAECEITFAMNWVTGSSGTVYAEANYRASADLSTGYQVRFTVDLDAAVQDTLTGVEILHNGVSVGSEVLSLVKPFGTAVRVKIRSTDNQYVRTWLVGSSEPSTWDIATGSGSLLSGAIGFSADVDLDSNVPAPLENVTWIWGAEQGMSGFGSTTISGVPSLISSSSTNINVTAAGGGRDGIGYACRVTVSGSTGGAQVPSTNIIPASNTKLHIVSYFKFVNSLPTASSGNYVSIVNSTVASGAGWQLALRTTDSRLVMRPNNTVDTGVVAGPVATTNTWYKADFTVDISANPWVFAWSIDDVAQTGTTRATATTTTSTVQFGPVANSTGIIDYDDSFIIVTNLAQYPITDDLRIVRKMPVATITESGTANIWCRFVGAVQDATFNAANILAAITEFPPQPVASTTSDGVYQRLTGSNNLATIPFDNVTLAAGEGIAAVRLEALWWTSAAGGADFAAAANVGGSNTSVWTATGASNLQTGNQPWGTAIYTPSGGWSETNFNALNLVLQSGTDVSPLPGYRFIMSEVAIRTMSDPGSDSFFLEFSDLECCALTQE